jgi:dihydroflavonol-4-reductase
MVLVTGATGFLGRYLVPLLVQEGYGVRALVRRTSEVGFLRELGVELVYGEDITDTTAVSIACANCEAVIHAAGQFRFWGSMIDFWQTNVEGTAVILEAAANAGVQKFIHISTIAVAGKIDPGQLIDEETPCRPQDAYQRTKYEGEQLALAYHQRRGLPVVVLRPGAFYGPWGEYAFNRLFFTEPLHGWRIKVAGGKHIIFPVYTADVAQGVLLGLKHGRAGEIYNICGESISHNQGNAIVSELADIYPWRLNVPKAAVMALAWAWTHLSRYTGREPFYPLNLRLYVFQDWQVSTAKAQRELGFRPTPFREGAAETLAWYRRNKKNG